MNTKNSFMTINGLHCIFNMPAAVKSQYQEGKEIACRLPPHAQQEVFPVDEHPACPANWMHGSDKASSYFVAIEEGKGLWLDFNPNFAHKHDVAVLISIQGVNPITGQKTEKMGLEQYKKNCPVHNIAFQQGRFCPECGYKWPAQNYMCTTGQPRGLLWLDGFRAEDGVVRQYIFTAEQAKGIAAQVIGEDRVFAIGVAFFLSKEPKKELSFRESGYRNALKDGGILYSQDSIPIVGKPTWNYKPSNWTETAVSSSCAPGKSDTATFKRISIGLNKSDTVKDCCSPCCSPPAQQYKEEKTSGGIQLPDETIECSKMDFDESTEPSVNYEIGAGAKIDQEVYPDPNELSFWQETPHFIYINYVDKKACQKILKAGKKDLTKGGEGFLAELEKVKT